MASEARGIVPILKQTLKDFSDDECPTMAAALSYYTVFALPPLLLLIVMIAGAVMDPQDVRDALQGQLGSLLGRSGGEEIRTIMEKAQETRTPDASRPVAAVLGVATLLLGATGVFAQLQAALNKAWEVKPDPEQGGIRNFLVKRIFSFGMILAVAFLLLVSLALTAAVSALGRHKAIRWTGIRPRFSATQAVDAHSTQVIFHRGYSTPGPTIPLVLPC